MLSRSLIVHWGIMNMNGVAISCWLLVATFISLELLKKGNEHPRMQNSTQSKKWWILTLWLQAGRGN